MQERRNIKNTLNGLRLSLLSAVLIFALLAVSGVSYAWYSSIVTKLHADMQTVSSASISEEPGYEVYKYDAASGQGVSVNPAMTQMNLYDKIYPANNANAKIILKAALSDAWESHVDNNGSIKLDLNCAYPGKGRDAGDAGINGAGAGDGIIDYLSNVVNIKAAYIPDITSDANNGNYDSSVYASADDYIYKAATAYFEGVPNAVSFVENTSVPGVHNEYPPVYQFTNYTSREAFANRTEKPNSSSVDENGISTTYVYKYAYMISDGAGHYMYLDGGQIKTGTPDLAGMSDSIMYSYGFSTTRDGSSYDYNFSNNNLNLYASAYGSTANLYASGSSSYFTVDNGLKLSKEIATSSGTRRYYIGFSNGSWGLSTGSSNLTITQIERCTKTEYKPASVSTGEKKIEISAALNDSTKEADGYYYIYIQLDYDKDLIDAYMLENSISLIVGNDDEEGSPFADIFTIDVADTEAP